MQQTIYSELPALPTTSSAFPLYDCLRHLFAFIALNSPGLMARTFFRTPNIINAKDMAIERDNGRGPAVKKCDLKFQLYSGLLIAKAMFLVLVSRLEWNNVWDLRRAHGFICAVW